MAKYIDLDKAKSSDERVNNFLVAKLLFEHCIDWRTKDGASSTIPPLVFFSRPAATQARYADFFGRSGQSNAAQRAWKEAERLHKELGTRTIDMGGGLQIRLNDLETARAEFGPGSAVVKALDEARRSIRYDFWLMRCRFEQRDEVQLARKLSYEAAELAKQSEWKKAMERYRRSLEIIEELLTQHPREMSLLVGDFSETASGYRKARKQLGEADEESLMPILEAIGTFQSFSTFPLPLNPGELWKK